VRQRALAGLILGAISLLALLATGTNYRRGIYLVIFALVVGAAACWLGVSAMRQARRARTMRPRGAIAATIFGGLGILFSAILLSLLAAFWSQFSSYSQCLGAAQTPSAQQACYNQFTRSVYSQLGEIGTSRGR
jgi:predicted PurR-regulated permease PerM